MLEDDISVIQDFVFAVGLVVGGADSDSGSGSDVVAVEDKNSSDMIELVLADAAVYYFDM